MNTIVVHGVSGLIGGMMYGAIGGTIATVLGAVRATSAGQIPAGNVTGAYFP